ALNSAAKLDVINGSTFNIGTNNATFTDNVSTSAGSGTLTGSGNVVVQKNLTVRTYSVTGNLEFSTTGGTWSSAAAPQNYQAVTIDTGASVTLGSNVRVTQLTIGTASGAGTLDVSGHTLDMAVGGTGAVTLGSGGAGTLQASTAAGSVMLLGDYTQGATA